MVSIIFLQIIGLSGSQNGRTFSESAIGVLVSDHVYGSHVQGLLIS
jgi:hypothetical protein